MHVGPYGNESDSQNVKELLLKSGFARVDVVQIKPEKTVEDLALEIINGEWGTGHSTRKRLLTQFGWLDYYSYDEIKNKVNELCSE